MKLFFEQAKSNIKTKPDLVINQYIISKIEDSSEWGAIKINEKKGKSFKTKKAAILFANTQNS